MLRVRDKIRIMSQPGGRSGVEGGYLRGTPPGRFPFIYGHSLNFWCLARVGPRGWPAGSNTGRSGRGRDGWHDFVGAFYVEQTGTGDGSQQDEFSANTRKTFGCGRVVLARGRRPIRGTGSGGGRHLTHCWGRVESTIAVQDRSRYDVGARSAADRYTGFCAPPHSLA